jgi:hypothetical protein
MQLLKQRATRFDQFERRLPNRYNIYFRIMFAILMRAMLDGSDGSTFNATTVLMHRSTII